MPIKIQFLIQNNPYLKKFLRENSFYYKKIIRNPSFINEIMLLMKKEYKLSLTDKLDKIKEELNMLNTVVNILN